MIASILMVMGLAAQTDDDRSSAETSSLNQKYKASFDDIQDFEFICEGRIYSVVDGSSSLKATYQSAFAYRRDGAAFLDFYKKSVEDRSMVLHSTQGILNGISTVATPSITPMKPGVTPSSSKAGSVMGMTFAGSPVRFLSVPFWDWCGTNATGDTRSLGIEAVDGHDCEVVEVDLASKNPNTASTTCFKLWIDMARGGNIIRQDFNKKGVTYQRAYPITLSTFTLKSGKAVWFPVHAEVEYFPIAGLIEVGGRETYDVVSGTLKFNAGLNDRYFDIVKSTTNGHPKLDSDLKREADSSVKAERERIMSDVMPSAEKSLEERLREADLQAKELEASAGSEDSAWTVSSLLMGVVGLLGLTGAILFRRLSPR